MEIIDVNYENAIDTLKKWYFVYDHMGELEYRPHSFEEYVQNLEYDIDVTVQTAIGKYEIRILNESYPYFDFDCEDYDLSDVHVDEIFFVNIKKRSSQLNIDELKKLLDICDKTLDFLKNRMKENIHKGEPELKIQKDANIKYHIEIIKNIIIEHLKYKERIILEKLKKYNLD